MELGFVNIVSSNSAGFYKANVDGRAKQRSFLPLRAHGYRGTKFFRDVYRGSDRGALQTSMRVSEDATKLIVVTGNNIVRALWYVCTFKD